MRVPTREIKFRRDVPGSEMFDVKWNNYSKGVITTRDLPRCFEILSAPSPPQKLSLVKVSYDPTKAPVTFDGFKMNINFLEISSKIPILIVNVKMVDNLESEANDLNVPRVFPETAKEESLSCQVCLAPFSTHIQNNVPRILTSCGHTICHNCAVTIQKISTNQLSIACPFDRIVTRMLAANLPRNFAIIDLIGEKGDVAELTPKMKASKICEDPIYPCYENPRHESTKYCRTCDADFCDSCFLSVHSSKILSGHQSYSVSQRRFRLPKCTVHSNKTVFHFCNDKKCKVSTPLCCNICIQSFHRNHSTVPIEERSEQKERQLTKLFLTLNWYEERKKKSLQQAELNLECLNKRGIKYRRKITAINLLFEQKRVGAAIKRLNYLVDSKKGGFAKVKRDIEHDLEGIRKTKKEIENVLERKDILLLFTQEISKKGKALCKEVTVVPYALPTVREIRNSTSKFAKTMRAARQLLNGSFQELAEVIIVPFFLFLARNN